MKTRQARWDPARGQQALRAISVIATGAMNAMRLCILRIQSLIQKRPGIAGRLVLPFRAPEGLIPTTGAAPPISSRTTEFVEVLFSDIKNTARPRSRGEVIRGTFGSDVSTPTAL